MLGSAGFPWATALQAQAGLDPAVVISAQNLLEATTGGANILWFPGGFNFQFSTTGAIASGGNAGIVFPVAYLATPVFFCTPVATTNNTLGHTVGGRGESGTVGRVYNTSGSAAGSVAAAWLAFGRSALRT